jgi:thiamine-phosphate pyrophosphorylase
MLLPKLYPIIDLGSFASAADPVIAVTRFAEDLLRGGATLLQYRDKSGDMRRFLSCARELRRITRGRAALIVNDRVDLCLAADTDGVHLGQDDLSPVSVRKILDSIASHPFAAEVGRLTDPSRERMGHPNVSSVDKTFIVGFSTHNLDQVREADAMPVDYVAVGPVFATASKAKPDPVIGLEGVRQARAATTKPLVAIGGITRKNCRQVLEAGADSVAVISDLLESPVKALEEFRAILG